MFDGQGGWVDHFRSATGNGFRAWKGTRTAGFFDQSINGNTVRDVPVEITTTISTGTLDVTEGADVADFAGTTLNVRVMVSWVELEGVEGTVTTSSIPVFMHHYQQQRQA